MLLLLATLIYAGSRIGFASANHLLWVAPLPLLLYALNHSTQKTACISFLVYSTAFVGSLYHQYTRLPDALKPFIPSTHFVCAAIMMALIVSGGIVLFRYLVLSSRRISLLFFLPCYWVSFEYIWACVTDSATNISIATTQLHYLPIMQIASLTGIWGISFLLLLLPSGLAVAWRHRRQLKSALACLASTLSIIIIVLLYGLYQLQHSSTESRIRVGLIALPTTLTSLREKQLSFLQIRILNLHALIKKIKAQYPDIIVLPEKAITVTAVTRDAVQIQLQRIANKEKMTLVIGINDITQHRNSAWIVTPQHSITLYHKQHLLPFGSERHYIPGKTLGFVPAHPTWGVAICHDSDFHNTMRHYAQHGARLLFLPALDFKIDALAHARVALIHSIANGYALVRVAQWGLLSVSDRHGHILAQQSDHSAIATQLITTVSPGKPTFYSQWGDWFAWLCIACTVWLIKNKALL